MKIHLHEDMERFVKEKLSSGEYDSPSEIINAAMRLLSEQDCDKEPCGVSNLDELNHEIQKGIDQLDRGERLDGDEVFRRLYEEMDRDDAERAS